MVCPSPSLPCLPTPAALGIRGESGRWGGLGLAGHMLAHDEAFVPGRAAHAQPAVPLIVQNFHLRAAIENLVDGGERRLAAGQRDAGGQDRAKVAHRIPPLCGAWRTRRINRLYG